MNCTAKTPVWEDPPSFQMAAVVTGQGLCAGQSLLNELLNYSSMEGTKEHGFSLLEDLAKVISFHMSRALTQDTRR